MIRNSISVVIPTIPPREHMLNRALESINRQFLQPRQLIIEIDHRHEGAWATRQRGAERASGEWLAFLDDDDEMLPWHLSHLLWLTQEHEADMTWGWFHVVGGGDPFPHYRGRQYTSSEPHIVPITYLIRHDLFMAGPGFQPDGVGAWDNQDQPVVDDAFANGKLIASARTTWLWHHHGMGYPGTTGNTSGLPTRW